MPDGASGEGEIARQIAERFPRSRNVRAAQHPVHTDVAGRRQRLSCPVRRRADDFHIGHGAGNLDAPVEFPQHLRRSAHVLEADVAQAEIGNEVQRLQAILHRLVAARKHEDKVHHASTDGLSPAMLDYQH